MPWKIICLVFSHSVLPLGSNLEHSKQFLYWTNKGCNDVEKYNFGKTREGVDFRKLLVMFDKHIKSQVLNIRVKSGVILF